MEVFRVEKQIACQGGRPAKAAPGIDLRAVSWTGVLPRGQAGHPRRYRSIVVWS